MTRNVKYINVHSLDTLTTYTQGLLYFATLSWQLHFRQIKKIDEPNDSWEGTYTKQNNDSLSFNGI